MMQLAMPIGGAQPTLAEAIDSLTLRRCARGVTTAHLAAARQATTLRFAGWEGRALAEDERERVRAYFDAVVRRRVLTMADGDSVRARRALVAASIEADLLAAGWSRERARDESMRAVSGPRRESAA